MFIASYFAPLAIRLRAEGYEVKKNLWGAPYDFRKAPGLFGCWLSVLKKLKQTSGGLISNISNPLAFFG